MSRGRRARLLAVAGVWLALTTGCGSGDQGETPHDRASTTATSATTRLPDVPVARAAGRTPPPVWVSVPRLDIRTPLDRLTTDSHGVLERPPHWQRAGWYAGGPRPGQTGPAVIAGHVDSPTGPAAFTGLSAVRPSDQIVVGTRGGRRISFVVTSVGSAPKHHFPTRAVYGPTPDAELRLVTCTGPYLTGAGGYRDNLIVFAVRSTG